MSSEVGFRYVWWKSCNFEKYENREITALNSVVSDDLLVREKLDPQQAHQLRLATILVCIVSVVVTAGEGSATLG